MAVDSEGLIFVAGSTIGQTDFGNGKSVTIGGTDTGTFLACFNSVLECQWAIGGFGPKYSYGWDVNLDKDENILLTGRFGSSFTITGTDGESITTDIGGDSTQDTYVAKLSHEGVAQWITYVKNSDRFRLTGQCLYLGPLPVGCYPRRAIGSRFQRELRFVPDKIFACGCLYGRHEPGRYWP